MRFRSDGPAIPDELLVARDDGRVVFFCGAGVSKARSGLPDFLDLADTVAKKLGAAREGAARKAIDFAKALQGDGKDQPVSVDRIFAYLEQEFDSSDIASEVAIALKRRNVDLAAHKIILDLATTPQRKLLLVTTNFDRLFEQCAPLQTWTPPRLPDPHRPSEMDGVVHLHGAVNARYSGAVGSQFVLSSAEFGLAYLADGWATSFVRRIIERYLVVFIGYSADDPPMLYLLEALDRSSSSKGNLFAFHSGDADNAIAKWRPRGVEPIAYDPSNRHSRLWDTLGDWAIRARDPGAWLARTLRGAASGPRKLLPHERGQVAHVVSTAHGAKAFAAEAPNSEWLCVFDPAIRYSDAVEANDERIDPFELYGLDSDTPPISKDPSKPYTNRATPKSAWSAFDIVHRDLVDANKDTLGRIAENYQSPPLVPRLHSIGVWLAKVAREPTAVWWASGRGPLHPRVVEWIKWEIERTKLPVVSAVRKAWRHVIEAWGDNPLVNRREWFDLKAEITKFGMDGATIRTLRNISRPVLVIRRPFGSLPPTSVPDDEIRTKNLVGTDVSYPDWLADIKLEPQWLPQFAALLRINLLIAAEMENETNEYELENIATLFPDQLIDGDSYSGESKLSGYVRFFCAALDKLRAHSTSAFSDEIAQWPPVDHPIFGRLRIWLGGHPDWLPASRVASDLISLPPRVFWSARPQRDVLLAMSRRWSEMSVGERRALEQKLLGGRPQWPHEPAEEYEENSAEAVLDRIVWLEAAGCQFDAAVQLGKARLRSKAPHWIERRARSAADTFQSRGGWVRTDTGHDRLRSVPLTAILQEAQQEAGRDPMDFLVERDPFLGLSQTQPVRALRALVLQGRSNVYPEWAWRRFLSWEGRKSDSRRLTLAIAQRLLEVPSAELIHILHPVADWIRGTVRREMCGSGARPILLKLVRKCALALQDRYLATPDAELDSFRDSSGIDWAARALNSPAGMLTEALMADKTVSAKRRGKGLPVRWLNALGELLSMPPGLREQVLVIVAFQLRWLFYREPEWTDRSVIAHLRGSDPSASDAVWQGVLWAAKVPQRALYMLLKPYLLGQPERLAGSRYSENVAAYILAGWMLRDARGRRSVTSVELRELLIGASEEFRSHILWVVKRWGFGSEETHRSRSAALQFVAEVWPRQKSVRSSTVSARLCEIAFAGADEYPKIVEQVLPLLAPIDEDSMLLHEVAAEEVPQAINFGPSTLALLTAILPTDTRRWPRDVERVLELIVDRNPVLVGDEKFVDLNRRWNGR